MYINWAGRTGRRDGRGIRSICIVQAVLVSVTVMLVILVDYVVV